MTFFCPHDPHPINNSFVKMYHPVMLLLSLKAILRHLVTPVLLLVLFSQVIILQVEISMAMAILI